MKFYSIYTLIYILIAFYCVRADDKNCHQNVEAKISTEEIQLTLDFGVFRNDPEQIKKAINAGADVNHNNGSLLTMAILFKCDDAAQILLMHGADPNIKYENQDLIELAALNGLTKVATLMLQKGANFSENTMYWAIKYRSNELIEELINRGYSLNPTSPHMWFVLAKRPEALKFLLQKGANPNQKLNDGRTPLLVAIDSLRCPKEAIKVLIDAGADLNQVIIIENKVITPLSYAEYYEASLAPFLIELGASLRVASI